MLDGPDKNDKKKTKKTFLKLGQLDKERKKEQDSTDDVNH